MFAFSSLPFESGEKMEFSFSFSLSLITFFEVYDEWFCCEMKSHSLTLTLTRPSPVSCSSRYILSLSLCHGWSSLPLEFIHFYHSLLFHPLYNQCSLHPFLFLSLSLSLTFFFYRWTILFAWRILKGNLSISFLVYFFLLLWSNESYVCISLLFLSLHVSLFLFLCLSVTKKPQFNRFDLTFHLSSAAACQFFHFHYKHLHANLKNRFRVKNLITRISTLWRKRAFSASKVEHGNWKSSFLLWLEQLRSGDSPAIKFWLDLKFFFCCKQFFYI